ncbi:carbohydrate kinase family protein [Roseofilum casamattae]|uniref:Carbohydrate kinase n=1 Tax=Roseofilum casamattae BLCC-M143 TaxID=3022442 RepID=A0ABT7BV20_9CYAN|nr:carbohydrate kinase [Roseofilum casamattae]MDJ1183033.1 carbohydrate kinase [Roseofilum casamattae BLCC-M143]
MDTAQVLCLGELLFDCLADRAGLPYEQVTSWTQYPGGAPANVACGLVKLGTSSAFLGSVGSDEVGNALVKVLETAGVDIQGVQRHSTAPTRQVYVVRSYSGDRYFAGFGDRECSDFADAYLNGDLLPIELFRDAQYLVLGTLELAYPQTEQAIRRALELANEYYLKLVVDVNWRPRFWPDPERAKPLIYDLLGQVDFVKLSVEEAQFFFETTDPAAIRDRLPDLEGVAITAGDGPLHYAIGEGEGILPAFTVDVKDTTGAGDAFVAGWVRQLCRYGISALESPQKVKETIVYASAVSALTATEFGAMAAQPTSEQVEQFLQEEGIAIEG